MQKLKLWEKELLQMVAEGLRKHGYEKSSKRQAVCKKYPFGRAAFHLAFIEHQDDVDVTTDVGLRFDQVEELVNRDDKLLTKAEKAETFTMGCELGNLSEGGQKRWSVLAGEDVPIVGGAILSTLSAVGLPYVEKYSDAANALIVLSGDSPDSWLHCPLHGSRAKKAVAMAFLSLGEEAARELARAKLAFLEDRKDFGLPSFRSFLATIGLDRMK